MGKVQEVNCTTGERIERDETAEEIAIREQAHAELLARDEAFALEQTRIANLKESAKAKLIAGTPLTEEEASVLVI